MSKSDGTFYVWMNLAESGVAAVSKPWRDEPASDSGIGRRSSGISGDRGDPWKKSQ